MFDHASIVYHEEDWDEDRHNMLVMPADAGPNNRGYSMFVACLSFDDEGVLKAIGAWE
jgi:hypothetical protein